MIPLEKKSNLGVQTHMQYDDSTKQIFDLMQIVQDNSASFDQFEFSAKVQDVWFHVNQLLKHFSMLFSFKKLFCTKNIVVSCFENRASSWAFAESTKSAMGEVTFK